MKKILFVLIICIMFVPKTVKAGNTYPINSKASATKSCSIRTEPNEGGNWLIPGSIHWLDPNDNVILIDGVSPIDSNNFKCSSKYYYVSYVGNKGYVCGDYINFEYSGKYDEEFKLAGFPQSYWMGLNSLKEAHPNWKFIAYKNNIDWNEAISAESAVEYNSSSNRYWSRSYINKTNSLFLSKEEGVYDSSNNTFKQLEVGGWYAANKKTVAYYMDPRNFLNDRDVFMFESNYSNQTRQTKETLTSMFSKNAHAPYVNDFYDAATAGGNNVSSTMLGARSRLEVGGTNLSNAATGKNGYYNFYNIGALSSCTNPVACGENFASGKGWTSARTSIIGGAAFIDKQYIKREQKTIYFQKFNTTTNDFRYTNQYMNNIEAPKNEATIIYNAYVDSNTLNMETEFFIPVYNSMPDMASSLPTSDDDNQNNDQNNNKNNNQSNEKSYDNIQSVINNAGYNINNNCIHNISVGTTTERISSNLKSKGNVSVNISGRPISANENLKTGDTIEINNGKNSLSYKIVVKGDVNGDGNIKASDYVTIKNHIMGKNILTNEYLAAADVISDGSIKASDYVKIKNYIMGTGSL